jgi:hypothetical protein
MRKKIEEQLAKLAFGDIDAEEARLLELRTQSDPEAARTIEMYRRMKDELRSLSLDVPEDQLSKERLREAILTRGLDRKAEPARPTWLWMPAAAAVLAFGIVFVKGQIATGSNPGTMIVDNSKAKFEAPQFEYVKPSVPERVATTIVTPKVVSEKEPVRVAVNDARTTRWDRRDEIGSRSGSRDTLSEPEVGLRLTSLDPTAGEMGESVAMKDGVKFDGEKKADPAPARDLSAASQPTIVVIQPETDSDTGTLKATEIGNTTNVLVGG